MIRLRGRVDFEALRRSRPGNADMRVRDHRGELNVPGLALDWDARQVDVGVRDSVVAVAIGRARDDIGDGAKALRWIDRYQQRGAEAAADVGGGFAAAIIDCTNARVVLVVDRFGIETLCYTAGERAIAFADAAHAVPGSSRTLDPQAILDYLYFHVVPAPRTIYDDVLRMEPAHRLTASTGSALAQSYWKPRFIEDDRSRLAQRMHQFVETVRASVAMEADDARTACFLSGGTDSSTIAGMLTRIRGEPAHAYSIGFEAEGYDEMAYARIAARHFGLAHHEYYVTPDDLAAAIPKVAESLDQPFGNSSVLPAYFCALRAREDGFTRMLAGDGGDELFGGNSRYAVQSAFEGYHAIPAPLRRAMEPVADTALFRKVPGLRHAGGYVRHARAPMPDRLNAFNLLRFTGEDVLLDPRFRASVDSQAPLAQQRATWQGASAGAFLNRMLAYDWKYTLADSDLPKVRAATQLAGVSVGYPFLARALVDFSLDLPPRWKVRGHKLRWFFKEALRGFLPVEILRKRKHGFGLPFGPWLVRHEALQALARDSLDGLAQRGVICRSFPIELMERHLPEAPRFYGELVWILMMLEQWLRHQPTNEAGTVGSGSATANALLD
jgi:asparagine synthase (glutamine-hydrolysing)